MARIHQITPCLWFDKQGEEAARFYTSVFPNSKVGRIARYPEAGKEVHRQQPGSVMMVEFELNGQPFLALNGGPEFQFNEAISLQIICEDQKEIDHYWNKLGAGGDPKAQVCGWLKDRYGVSWQVVPEILMELHHNPSTEVRDRVMAAMMKMQKIDIAAIEQAAFAGQSSG
jgi:predicted 3-demethylubiquinone-9 3-methyltransferase (glyoxalase superfamily)